MKTKKTEVTKIPLPRQLSFDFDSMGSIVLVCGNGDGCRKKDCYAITDSESCPGCNARLQRKGACWTCQRCGYKTCGGE